MQHSTETIRWRDIALDAGEQAVINGALVSAEQPCNIRVADCATVLTARAISHCNSQDKPGHALYYATLLAIQKGDLDPATKMELLGLLGRVVVQSQSRDLQDHCAQYASAITSCNSDRALDVARILAKAEAVLDIRQAVSPLA